MGDVIIFARRHRRASRAAISVKSEAEIPAARTVSQPKRADQRSQGMESRCHHLETAQELTPISDAIAPREGQSSITDRNEFMESKLGHSVLEVKDNQPLDGTGPCVLPSGMSKTQASAAFKRAFIARTKAAREAKGLTQDQMARLLGLKQDRYKQYETRTMLPHELIPVFCFETGIAPRSLFPDWRVSHIRSEKEKAS